MKKSPIIFFSIIISLTAGLFFTPQLRAGDSPVRQVARVREDLRVVREDQRKLHLLVQEQQRTINQLRGQLADLSEQLSQLRSESSRDGAARSDVEALRRAIREESQAREKAIDTVIETLSEEIAAVSARQTTAQTPARSSTEEEWSGSVQGEYTVASGDTLSAIAQAFGITVNRLKRANNLQGDLIREGQVLTIPE